MQKYFSSRRVIFFCTLLVSQIFADPCLAISNKCYEINVSDSQATFTGCIDSKAVEELIVQIKKDPTKPLAINSAGGDVIEAIRLTKFLNEQVANVKIFGQCMSSCANYLLLYLKNLSITPSTVILFHGRPWDSFIRERADEVTMRIFSEIQRIEEEFVATNKKSKFALDLVSKTLLPSSFLFEIRNGIGPDCKGFGLGASSLIILPAALADLGVDIKITEIGDNFKLNVISESGEALPMPKRIRCVFHE